jgi:hypothetical protein
MARIRTIKPEFFTSSDIVGLSAFARLLYVALWCEADREGRLKWRPDTYKLRYFPADGVDINALANELTAHGLVVLYGEGLAWIPTFKDHQHINPREAQSLLPPPPVDNSRVNHASSRVSDVQVGREGKEGKERNDASQRVEPRGASAPKAKSEETPRWWETPESTMAEAQRLGLSTRGRDWVQLKSDIRDAHAKTTKAAA